MSNALAPAVKGARDVPVKSRRAPRLFNLPTLAIFAAILAVNAVGIAYYAAPLAGRLRHPLHDVFKPSGLVGQSLGILALAMFLFLWLYPLRRRFHALAFTGSIGRWLDVHIVIGLTCPLVAATHAAWRFNGIVGVGFLSMVAVALSGIVGRYLYTQIPRRLDGLAMSQQEMESEREELTARLAAETGLSHDAVQRMLAVEKHASTSMLGSLAQMIANDFRRRRAPLLVVRAWRQLGAGRPDLDWRALRRLGRLARRELALVQRMSMLGAAQRLFRFWHVAHRPLSITALVAVLVHVVVAIGFGATWFR